MGYMGSDMATAHKDVELHHMNKASPGPTLSHQANISLVSRSGVITTPHLQSHQCGWSNLDPSNTLTWKSPLELSRVLFRTLSLNAECNTNEHQVPIT